MVSQTSRGTEGPTTTTRGTCGVGACMYRVWPPLQQDGQPTGARPYTHGRKALQMPALLLCGHAEEQSSQTYEADAFMIVNHCRLDPTHRQNNDLDLYIIHNRKPPMIIMPGAISEPLFFSFLALYFSSVSSILSPIFCCKQATGIYVTRLEQGFDSQRLRYSYSTASPVQILRIFSDQHVHIQIRKYRICMS